MDIEFDLYGGSSYAFMVLCTFPVCSHVCIDWVYDGVPLRTPPVKSSHNPI